MAPHERLEAWQAAHQLVVHLYQVTRSFPAEERYGLCSQIRRAAFSIPANIAEGAAKKGPREFRRYLDIAVGSMAELSYALRLVRDLKILSVESCDEIEKRRDLVGKLTWRLYVSMRTAVSRSA